MKQTLQKVVDAFELGNISEFKKLTMGIANTNWHILTNIGEYIIREISADTSLTDTSFEHKVLVFFSENTPYHFPKPLRTKESTYIAKVNEQMFWVYEFISGTVEHELIPKRITEIAHMMITLHKVAKNSAAPLRKNIYTKEYAQKQLKKVIEDAQTAQDELATYVQENINEIQEILEKTQTYSFEEILIHRDITTENILFKEEILTGVLDVEYACTGSAIEDVTIFMQREFCIEEKMDFGKAQHFLQEYQRYRTFSHEEIQAIPDIAIIQYVEDLAYFYWVIRNQEQKDVDMTHVKLRIQQIRWYHENKQRITDTLSN